MICFDRRTVAALAILLPVMAIFTEHHFADILDGGRFAHMQAEEVRGVPKHNKVCEQVFGQLEGSKHHSPHKSEGEIKAKISFSLN